MGAAVIAIRFHLKGRSDRHAAAVKFVILVVAALACAKTGKVVHELDGGNPFDQFETKSVLAAQPQRRANH